MFQASVDTQVILTDVQKFMYLKEHLRDAAAETISGLQLSSANYRIAKDLLYRHFGNVQIQMNAHHVVLMELPVASNKTSSLRKLYDAGGAVANWLRRRTSDQTVLGSNPAVAAALSPWTRLFTPIVPRRSLHISFY